ncbi:PREDICTED: E3 ubiquitin-protein ligase LRSAM1-like [Diuraphis noxia]|uniref:E3 ubiquitin-protein ligase LRSAM1-like n=1 Tax=Diuraphis noxia TaxID=143948 RepID=UPI0007635AA3|nr:PREDICTED: E3 ubiquitin-protein ligase LRSAM1-like [Diuraphis noxia]
MSFFSIFSKKNNSSSNTQKNQSKDILSRMVDQDLVLQDKLEKLEKQKNLRKQNLLNKEKNIKECEENKIRLHQKNSNNDKDTTIKWLSQYSKLVNDMPSELMFSKKIINPALLHRVCTAGGGHLLLFILENDLILPLTKEYLVKMGVKSCDDQAILINTLNYFPIPSASTENEVSPSAPFLEDVECIICMETKFDVLFIPCGHLCCCGKCSEQISLCPMCRTEILHKYDVKNIT